MMDTSTTFSKNEFRDAVYASSLPALTRSVLVALSDCGSPGRRWPSQETLAQKVGVKRPATIGKHLKRAEAAGWVTWTQPGMGMTNRYRLYIPPEHRAGDSAGDAPQTPRETQIYGARDALPDLREMHPGSAPNDPQTYAKRSTEDREVDPRPTRCAHQDMRGVSYDPLSKKKQSSNSMQHAAAQVRAVEMAAVDEEHKRRFLAAQVGSDSPLPPTPDLLRLMREAPPGDVDYVIERLETLSAAGKLTSPVGLAFTIIRGEGRRSGSHSRPKQRRPGGPQVHTKTEARRDSERRAEQGRRIANKDPDVSPMWRPHKHLVGPPPELRAQWFERYGPPEVGTYVPEGVRS